MEPTPKNNDCYFFYYSTCTKGDNCAFRHEPSALGCEVMCSYWQQGNCLNEHCNFRHMELKKNRKLIPCFWETQRGGCKKPHCPFLHAVPRASPDADAATTKTEVVATKPPLHEWSTLIGDDGKYDGSGCESDQGRGSSEAGSFIGSPAVDPLIVNFDEGTLSLPSSLQTNLNLRNTLTMRNGLSIPVDIPSSLNITGAPSGIPNPMNVPPTNVQSLQQNPCHHVPPQYGHQANFHSHAHPHGQNIAGLQNQPSSSSQIHRNPYPPSHPEQTVQQPQRSRFPFPFLLPSYRRY